MYIASGAAAIRGVALGEAAVVGVAGVAALSSVTAAALVVHGVVSVAAVVRLSGGCCIAGAGAAAWRVAWRAVRLPARSGRLVLIWVPPWPPALCVALCVALCGALPWLFRRCLRAYSA